jgi:AraC family transcriptional regulator
MQEAYTGSKMPAEVAPIPALAHRPVDAMTRRDCERHLADSASADRPTPQESALVELRNAVADLLYALSRAFQHKPEAAYGYVLSAAELLRNELAGEIAGFEIYDSQSSVPAPPRGGLAPWVVRKVSIYIETHLDSAISSADLAGLANHSVYHFSRAFRESFDEPPHKYVMRRRIERAQGLMLRTNLPLAQIAIDCGLADQAHFNKSFRRFVGQSPGVWRRARATAAG